MALNPPRAPTNVFKLCRKFNRDHFPTKNESQTSFLSYERLKPKKVCFGWFSRFHGNKLVGIMNKILFSNHQSFEYHTIVIKRYRVVLSLHYMKGFSTVENIVSHLKSLETQ